jgi:DNA-binding NtrC family response regulator
LGAVPGPVSHLRSTMKALSPIHSSIGRDVTANFTSGRKTILLVDDDPNVRRMLALRLDQTYDVLAAADGVEAAHVFERHFERIAAIVTDLEMPRLDGQTLAAWVHHINPRLPIIIMSGGLSNGDSEEFKRPIIFLGKPFEPSRLEALLNEIL